jgi:hypothetical protein
METANFIRLFVPSFSKRHYLQSMVARIAHNQPAILLIDPHSLRKIELSDSSAIRSKLTNRLESAIKEFQPM